MSNSSSLNLQQPLLFLAQSAADNYKTNELKNQRLSSIAECQNDFLEEITFSMPEIDSLIKKIDEVDQDLENANLMLIKSQNALHELLLTKPQSSQADPGAILSSILSSIENTILSISLEAVSNEQTDTSLLNIVDLENQVSKMIEQLVEREMFPETEQELHNRITSVSQHNKRLVVFLQEIQNLPDS